MSNDQYGAVDAELVPGALRGYRSWRVLGDELVACNTPVAWPVGVMESEHVGYPRFDEVVVHSGCKGNPQKDHSCGIYAAHKLGGEDNRGWILGSIKAYGKIIVGTRGFRAGKAEIEALTLSESWISRYFLFGDTHKPTISELWDRVDKLGEKYQVPVFRSAEALVEAFPPISVEHILGDWEAEEARKQEEIFGRVAAWQKDGVSKIHSQIEEIEAYLRAAQLRGEW